MKTILYHGSADIIQTPEIREPNRTLDFGKGFYLTSSDAQAENLVRSRFKTGWTHGYVNSYHFDIDEAKPSMKIKAFTQADAEWVDFVLRNRMTDGFEHGYDIVIGPVANDKVYTQFSLFEGGVISKETLIEELKAYKLIDQYLFHTAAALKFLKFITYREILP